MEESTLVCLTATLYGGATDEALFETWEKLYLSNSEAKAVFVLLADLMPAERRRVDRDIELISRAERKLAYLEDSYGKHFALFIRERRCMEGGVYRSFGGQTGALRELCLYLRKGNASFFSALRRFAPSSVQQFLALDRTVTLGVGALAVLTGSDTPTAPKKRGADHPLCLSCSVDLYLQKTDINEAAMFSLPLVETLLRVRPVVCRVFFEKPADAVARFAGSYRRMCADFRGFFGCFAKIRNSSGEKQANHLSHREKLALLLHCGRSFLPFFIVCLLLFSALLGRLTWWMLFLTLSPVFVRMSSEICVSVPRYGLHTIRRLLYKAFRRTVSIAYEAYLFAYVLCTAGQAPSDTPPRDHLHFDDALLRFSPSMMIGLVLFCLPGGASKLMGALWIAAPVLFYMWSKEKKTVNLCTDDRETLRRHARCMWLYFRDGVTATSHHLPPSHIGLFPSDTKANEVTPGDIGCYLGALLSARLLGFIEEEDFYRRCASVTDTLTGLYKWHGQLFAGYYLHTLAPLGTPKISTRENGFFLVCLLTFLSGLKEYAREDPRLLSCAVSLETLLGETELSVLFDSERGLFFKEYDVEKAIFSGHHEELFGGGFFMTYLASVLGAIPREAYFSPARPPVGSAYARGVASENGTAEDFFLPGLFLPQKDVFPTEIRRFAWQKQKKNAVHRRIFGRRHRFFGRAEAPYFHFDEDADYRTADFGLPLLSRGHCRDEDVIAPHASLLMLSESPETVISLCKGFVRIGAQGKYGFFDAVDFDERRVGKGYAVIRRFSARGCGLGLLSIANALTNEGIRRHFMKLLRFAACTHLFREDIPAGATVKPPVHMENSSEPSPPRKKDRPSKYPQFAHTLLHPDVALLSNNQTRILASSSGHVAVYSGSLNILPSAFDLFSMKDSFRAETVTGEKSFPFVPLGRKEAFAVFSFLPSAEEICFRGRHMMDGRQMETTLRLTVSPCKEMFSVALSTAGRIKNCRLRLSFSPALYRPGDQRRALTMTYYQKENAAVLCSDKSPEIYLAITSAPRASYEIFENGEIHCTASGSRVRFTFAISDDEDEALYLLSHNAGRFDSGALRDLQYRAAGLSFSPWEAERFLLRGLMFGQIRPRTETYAHPDGQYLFHHGISKELPIVLLSGFSDLGEQRERLYDLIALFKFLCIRGVRFQLVILHHNREEAVRRCLKRTGCENFISYQAGIFSVNTASLSGAERFALELYSRVIIDLTVPLRDQISENARAIPLSGGTETMLLQSSAHGHSFYDSPRLSLGNVTASLRETRLEGFQLTANETLRLRIRSRTAFTDYDLFDELWQRLSDAVCTCAGRAGDVRFSAEIRLTDTGKKQIRVSLFTDREVHLALIFGLIPILGKEKRPPRFYRFRREGESLGVYRFSENLTPSVHLFCSVPSQPITERAALNSDGAVFRGENDMASLVATMRLLGTGQAIFTLAGETGEGMERYTSP